MVKIKNGFLILCLVLREEHMYREGIREQIYKDTWD
jgi:hypothetical protein